MKNNAKKFVEQNVGNLVKVIYKGAGFKNIDISGIVVGYIPVSNLVVIESEIHNYGYGHTYDDKNCYKTDFVFLKEIKYGAKLQNWQLYNIELVEKKIVKDEINYLLNILEIK